VIELDENGNLIIDGKRDEMRDPLTFFSKDASTMHGRFGSYDVPRQNTSGSVDQEEDVDGTIDPEFEAKIDGLLQFDRH